MVPESYRPRQRKSRPRFHIKQPMLPLPLADRLAILGGGPLSRRNETEQLKVCRCVPTTPDGVFVHSAEIPCAHSTPWPSDREEPPTSNTGVN